MITVIVPVYNMEKLLSRCMKTLLKQTWRDYEILLIDDGSTDGSPQICDDYVTKYSPKVRTIHKSNGGLSSARNVGIQNAKGEFIIFPDPDDWVEPDYLKRLVELQIEYKADLTCIGHFIEYDSYFLEENKNYSLQIMNGFEAQRALIIPPCMNGFAWNKLYDLKIIREYKLTFLDDVGTTEDLDFAYRYLNYCSTIIFNPEERLYHYYQRENAATHSKFSVRQVEAIRTYEKIIKSSKDPKIIIAAKEEICNTSINLIWQYKVEKVKNIKIWKTLKHNIKQNLSIYLKSNKFNNGRKVQAILAYYVPDLFVILKQHITKEM